MVSLSASAWTLTAFTVGVEQDVGPMAGLHIRGVDVFVRRASLKRLTRLHSWILNGIDVRDCDVVALKSAVHFRAGFSGIAASILPVDAPGLSKTKTETFQRHHQAQPLWGEDPNGEVDYVPTTVPPLVCEFGCVRMPRRSVSKTSITFMIYPCRHATKVFTPPQQRNGTWRAGGWLRQDVRADHQRSHHLLQHMDRPAHCFTQT